MGAVKRKKDTASSAWCQAVCLCESYGTRPAKADVMLEGLSRSLSLFERRQCQRLFFGVLRYLNRIDHTIDQLVNRRPKPKLRAVLQVAIFDLQDTAASTGKTAQVVHHAVGIAKTLLSEAEARCVNAVLRKVLAAWMDLDASASKPIRFALPDWLWERWEAQFGAENTEALAKWTLEVPPVYVRVAQLDPMPDCLHATQWPDFYTYDLAQWEHVVPLLHKGVAYAQDPSTAVPPRLAAIQPGESVLELCASPGGKSGQLIEALGSDPNGLLVAVDLPGERMKRLDDNLRKWSTGNGPEIQLIAEDVFALSTDNLGQYDAVMLDAPCSNTGVIRRRVDVKWRLSDADIQACAQLQAELLAKAAEFVRPGGRLIYSTCSIEAEENEAVIEWFVEQFPDFELVEAAIALPWEQHHDGGGAFRLNRCDETTGKIS